MRVIAGKFRSRPLRSLHGLDIRPTSDRLRETLFNVLTAGNPQALAGSVWLDLFAGTGAVGIEALSRGAAKVYFVESSRQAAELIRTNLHSLGMSDGFQVLHDKALHAINKLEEFGLKPNFIFLDPPYRMREAYPEALARLGEASMAQKALIIAEHEKKFEPGPDFGKLHRLRKLEQGDAALSFYKAGQ